MGYRPIGTEVGGCTEGGRGGGAGIRMVGYLTIERGGVVGERKGGSCYHKGQIKGEEGAKGNKINNINMTEERETSGPQNGKKSNIPVTQKRRKMHTRKCIIVVTNQEWKE